MAENGRQNRDDDLILALARGLSIRSAAEEAKIAERTAYRRLSDPDFRRRVSAVRGELMDLAAGRLADGATEAADVLRELLTSDADRTRLAAARTILQQSVALREAGELEQRISRLEGGADDDDTSTLGVA